MKKKGLLQKEIAAYFKVNKRTIHRWIKKGHPIFGKVLRELSDESYDPQSITDLKEKINRLGDKTNRYAAAPRTIKAAAIQSGLSETMIADLLARGSIKLLSGSRFNMDELTRWNIDNYDGKTNP